MTKVAVDKSKLDSLAEMIAAKSKESLPLTIQEMEEAVYGILEPAGTIDITNNNTTVDVTQYAQANVNIYVPPDTDFVVELYWDDVNELWKPECTYSEWLEAYTDSKNIAIDVQDAQSDFTHPASWIFENRYLKFYYYVFIEGNQQVTIKSYTLDSTDTVTLVNTYSYIIPNLQSKTVTPTTSQQIITADSYGSQVCSDDLSGRFNSRTADIAYTWSTAGISTGNTYHIIASGTAANPNTAGRKTFSIDTDFTFTGSDVSIPYTGNASEAIDYIYINSSGFKVRFDMSVNNMFTISFTIYESGGYDGLEQVTVNAIPSEYIVPTGTKSITSNGTGIDVTAYATVDVNVPSSGGSIVISDTLDSNGGIIKTITTTGETVTLQSKTVTPSSVQQTITPDSGYTGLSEVIVNGNNELLYKALIERKVTGAVVATGIEDISSQSLSNLPTSVTSIRFPDLINVRGSYAVANSKGITVAVFEKPLTITSSELLYKCTKLTTVDMNLGTKLGSNYAFEGDSLLTTLILRNTTLYGLNALNHFNGTPFANGGSGGTIYIPKVLYDHLGDGSSSDYQAATNWSALYGYGTVTWAQIEGSQYENYYADGTPIS